MSGQLCLRWNNHSIAFNKLLKKLYLEDCFSDATILCHGRFYPVHRLVLSTCSEYFEEMFQQCNKLNHKHPFIIVKDVEPEEMEAILNYMYQGEVNVPQEQLPDLIKAAEAFKIKGLAVPDEDDSPSKRKSTSISSPEPVPKRSKKNELRKSRKIDDASASSENIVQDTNTSSLVPLSTGKIEFHNEDAVEVTENDMSENTIMIKEEQDYKTYDDDGNVDGLNFENSNDHYNENLELMTDGSIAPSIHENRLEILKQPIKLCLFPGCSYATKISHHMKRHCQIHTGEKPFKCPHCPYKTSQKVNLTRHINTYTMEKAFKCSYCSFECFLRCGLKSHTELVHN